MVKKLSDLYLDARKAFLETEDNQTASLLARNLLCHVTGIAVSLDRSQKFLYLVRFGEGKLEILFLHIHFHS